MLAKRYNPDSTVWDYVIDTDGQGYAVDEGFETYAAITILTKKRDPSRRGVEAGGYWADAFNDDGFELGSRLWVLYGDVLSATTAKRAKLYLEEAFRWWIVDGICDRIEVEVEVSQEDDLLFFEVRLFRDKVIPLWAKRWSHTMQDDNGLVPLAEAA